MVGTTAILVNSTIIMDDRLHKKMLEDTEELRALIGECSTTTIVGSISLKFLKWPSEDIGLVSPYRQLFFLLGLMLTKPEPKQPKEFDERCWEKSRELLQRIFGAYAYMFWPTPEEAPYINSEWRRAREVSMPAFLHYFNSGLLASTLQLKNRIERYIVPFDHFVHQIYGITGSEMLNILDSVSQIIQRDYDELIVAKSREEKARHELLERAELEGWNRDRIRSEALKSPYLTQLESFSNNLNKIFKIEYNELKKEFGDDLSSAFWRIYTSKRGEMGTFTYLTDFNAAEGKPIFLLDDKNAMIPSAHSLYMAILNVVERDIFSSVHRKTFLKHRDRVLEEETTEILRDYFGEQCTILNSVYETPEQQFEHDIIVLWGRKLFVFEAKASPPAEPFRDPDKAYIRIKRAFSSDRGIQKAYEQAHRVEAAMAKEGIVSFYDNKGKMKLELSNSNIDRVYCICVTRDNFGVLGTDLSLLLNKEKDNPYPWATNVIDLETLLDAWQYFGWGPERFCEYLEAREDMHGKVEADDELDYAGFLIEHGSFDWLLDEKDGSVRYIPGYSKVFDKIFYARRGGEAVRHKPHPPVITNLTERVKKWQTESKAKREEAQINSPSHKQGRNEPCACGSGKKYKHCCGR